LRPAHRGHCRKSIGGQEHAVADACRHGIHGNYRVAAIAAIQVQRLNQQQLLPFMAGVLLRGDKFADHTGDQHGSPRWHWIESTIPTMVASVGGSAGRNGRVASLLRTQ